MAISSLPRRPSTFWIRVSPSLRCSSRNAIMTDMNERPVILVVDDEESIRSALATLLGRAGFSVRSATNGTEATKSIQEQSPDLVLLDVVLDEANPNAMSGL